MLCELNDTSNLSQLPHKYILSQETLSQQKARCRITFWFVKNAGSWNPLKSCWIRIPVIYILISFLVTSYACAPENYCIKIQLHSQVSLIYETSRVQGTESDAAEETEKRKTQLRNIYSSPGCCGSVDWVLAWEPKCRQLNSQSGHIPWLQARSPVGGTQEATTHWCFSPSLFPSLPLSLKK